MENIRVSEAEALQGTRILEALAHGRYYTWDELRRVGVNLNQNLGNKVMKVLHNEGFVVSRFRHQLSNCPKEYSLRNF